MKFDIFIVVLKVHGTHSYMTAFVFPPNTIIFPENAWNAAVAKSPQCHRSRVRAGYLGAFGQRHCSSIAPQDVTQARNKLNELIWRTGIEQAPAPYVPA